MGYQTQSRYEEKCGKCDAIKDAKYSNNGEHSRRAQRRFTLYYISKCKMLFVE